MKTLFRIRNIKDKELLNGKLNPRKKKYNGKVIHHSKRVFNGNQVFSQKNMTNPSRTHPPNMKSMMSTWRAVDKK